MKYFRNSLILRIKRLRACLSALLFLCLLGSEGLIAQDCVRVVQSQGQSHEDWAQKLEACIDKEPRNVEALITLAHIYAGDELRNRGRSRSLINKAVDSAENKVHALEQQLILFRQGIHRRMPPFMTRMKRVDLAKGILRLTPESAVALEELGLNEKGKYIISRNRLKFDIRNRKSPGVERKLFSPDRLNLDVIQQQVGPLVTEDDHARDAYLKSVDFLERSLRLERNRIQVYKELAQLYFLEKDYHSALNLVTRMQTQFPDDSFTWFLAASVMHRMDNSDVAAGMIQRGKDLLSDLEVHALENISMLLRPQEQAKYDLQGQVYADEFWSLRDPILSTSVNERKVEHLVRLVCSDLLFDEGTGKLGRDTERGETFIRYGEPLKDSTIDGIIFRGDNPGVYSRHGTTLQMWNYGQFTLAFERIDFSDEWRLYSPSAKAFSDLFDFTEANMADYVLDADSRAKSNPELYFFKPPADALPVEWRQSSFKGKGSGVDRVIAYSVPLDSVLSSRSVKIDLSSNLFEQSTGSGEWNKLGFKSELFVANKDRFNSEWGGYISYSSDGRGGTTALEIFANGGDAMAVKRFRHEAKQYDKGVLNLSDLLLAKTVEEGVESLPSEWQRGELSIEPWGAVILRPEDKPYLYVEVYNLKTGDYDVEVSFRSKRKKRQGIAKVLNLFSGKNESVAASYKVSVHPVDDYQYLQLDLPDKEGDYILQVDVTQNEFSKTANLDFSLREE